jgi:hypothetical protein
MFQYYFDVIWDLIAGLLAGWLVVSMHPKVLRPAISIQVFLVFLCL